MFKKLLGFTIWAAITAALATGITNPQSGWLNVGALAMWSVIVMSFFCLLMSIICAVAIESDSADFEKKVFIAASASKMVNKPRSKLRTALIATETVITVALAAYVGLTVTAAFYLLAEVAIIAMGEISKSTAAKSPKAA